MNIIGNYIEHLSSLGCELIIFPEGVIKPLLSLNQKISLPKNHQIMNQMSQWSKNNFCSIVFGALEAEKEKTTQIYNTMFQFDNKGDLTGFYRKQKLVPFGETYPFGNLFPKLRQYILNTTDSALLARGNESLTFDFSTRENKKLKYGVLTCFESTSANITANYVKQNVDFIINATNDLWSYSKAAMTQHAVISIFRAIESRKPLLRISNGGFSCYINPFGKYYSTLPLFEKGMMVSYLKPLINKNRTIYSIWGDWIIILSVILLLTYLVYSIKNHIDRKL